MNKKNNISRRLIKVTREVFNDYVLPKIKEKYPGSIGKFFVIITSSVAYGVADKYSDLDIFVIFPKHKDYLKYHDKLNNLVESIEYSDYFYKICDKGIRFEFESFLKSDLLDLIKDRSDGNWLKQTEWLLCWFVNSITIYDPAKISEKIKKDLFFFPKKILQIKINNNIIALLKYRKIMFLTRDSYVFDVYFFKAFKKLLDLIFWNEKLYIPHPKWSFYLSEYIGQIGKRFHEELLLALHHTRKNKILFIEKWINLLVRKYDKQINRQLASYIIGNCQINNNYQINGNLYFKNYFEPIQKLDLIFSYLNEVTLDKEFYLVEETGLNYKNKLNYDKLLRIQDKYLSFDSNNYLLISDGIYKKIISYLVFVIWRKIRVAARAPLRKNSLNQFWYNLQVFEHFIELISRLKKQPLIHEYNQISYLKSEKTFKKVANLLLKSLRLSYDERINIYWECYEILVKYILNNKILTKFQVENPLIIQFDIEYWKYENLRL